MNQITNPCWSLLISSIALLQQECWNLGRCRIEYVSCCVSHSAPGTPSLYAFPTNRMTMATLGPSALRRPLQATLGIPGMQGTLGEKGTTLATASGATGTTTTAYSTSTACPLRTKPTPDSTAFGSHLRQPPSITGRTRHSLSLCPSPKQYLHRGAQSASRRRVHRCRR